MSKKAGGYMVAIPASARAISQDGQVKAGGGNCGKSQKPLAGICVWASATERRNTRHDAGWPIILQEIQRCNISCCVLHLVSLSYDVNVLRRWLNRHF